MSLFVLSVVLLCLVIAAWLWMKPHPRSPAIVPGALPFIGHSHQVIGDRKHLWNFFRKVQLYSLKNGGVCECWFGTHKFYVITDPEDSLTLSNTCLNKPYVYDFAKKFLNNGLITAQASIWKTHRKLLNPAFNQQVLNTYVNEINVQARTLVSKLAPLAGKEPFDVRKYLINYVLSTVTRTSLGLGTEDQVLIETDYAEAIDELVAMFCDRGQKVWLHSSYIYKWSAMKRKEDQLINTVKNIINPIIQKRKSKLKANNVPNNYNNLASTPGKFKPVLDQMLQLADEQNAFTDDDIREHIDTLAASSYHTTSSAVTFILLVIGKYQNVQERIYNELQEVSKHEDDDFTDQDLHKLVYLEAVIKESMRVYPVVPFIARKVDRDVNLKNCTLRAGSSCAIGLYGLLRHPLWGADAEKFRPERWLDPTTLPEQRSLYAAFGVGRRNCIGHLLSNMMSKIALAHICRRYHVTGDISTVVCEFDVALQPVKGHHIFLTSRK
uniref:Cytochrome P450 CYP141 n=1 Tax=Mythimna separata TaxID=271217 RepID=A0A7G3WA85_MYTSE|nr:cytochrome P450 CYP141 [Mythimna separata]